MPAVVSQRVTERLLDAAFAELVERGVGGLTVEGVASRSGIAKTTIYRRFNDALALAVAAVAARPEVDERVIEGAQWVVDRARTEAAMHGATPEHEDLIAAVLLAEGQRQLARNRPTTPLANFNTTPEKR